MSETKTREGEQYEKLQEIGRGAMESIAEMVVALECDYERLGELRDARQTFADAWEEPEDNDDPEACWETAWASAFPDESEELAELEKEAGDCESREDAEARIQEDPLSLQFRSGWVDSRDEMEPEEFELLLGTGGPAVRIIGEIRDGQAHRPRLQIQDWYTPWTDYYKQDTATLEAYCNVFYFGD